jgi:hypothetical protein
MGGVQALKSLANYIKYRILELDYQESQIGEPGGINMGTHIAKRQAIEMARWTLRELERFVEWEIEGEPGVFEPPLSAEERAFWAKAKARGVEVPADIEAQL